MPCFSAFFIIVPHMIILISPAKSLDSTPVVQDNYTFPFFQTDAYQLAKTLKRYDAADLEKLMTISEKLSSENVLRFKKFRAKATLQNAKRAIDSFNGDVYRGLDSSSFSEADYEYAQKHLRILSGIYGVLRPLDLIQPYRLEMGTRIETPRGTNLYQFWGDKITHKINKALRESDSKQVINLASKEYFKSVRTSKIKGEILSINFKEYHDGTLKFLSFPAKVARGSMARFILKNRIEAIEDVKGFAEDNYSFYQEESSEHSWTFIR